jgi:hypothetical protein
MKYAVSAVLAGCLLYSGINLAFCAAEQPTYVEVYNPAGVRDDGIYVDKLLAKSMKETKRRGPQLAGDFPEVRIEKIKVKTDAFAEINALFYARGWTDGLPVVLPTPDRVKAMLRGTDLDPKFVVAELDPMNGQATIEKIAVNAVMAGCKPEYMPVLIAAVTALADPDVDLRGYATTTSPDTTLLILTGPIIKDIDFNAETNTMGRGRQANSTIGRAIQLIINDIGGSWPGITDMSSLGSPAEYGWVIAENASANPWTSLNLDVGVPKNASAVTVMGAEGLRGVIGSGRTSEGFLKLVADHMAGLAAQRSHWPTVLLVIAKDTAAQLAREGWTKQTIREGILSFANNPASPSKSGQELQLGNVSGENSKTQAQLQIDQFLVLVAGGPGEKSMIIPGWLGATKAVSKEIRLPGNWEQIKSSRR